MPPVTIRALGRRGFPSACALVFAASQLGGCVGDIGSGGTSATPRPPGEVEEPLVCNDEATLPGPSPLRRLTRADYDNTVRDLLGDTSHPASSFPVEEEQFGFTNNADVLSVSLVLAEQYEQAADKLSAAAVGDLVTLLGCDPATLGENECATNFIKSFGKRAYRRPLDIAEELRLFTFYSDMKSQYDFTTAIRLLVKALLQSPDFLYRVELGMPSPEDEAAVKLSQYEMASRLSYLLWNSMPDDQLLEAADFGELSTPEEIEAQARRMLTDDRARQALTNFHRQWLHLDKVELLEKDPVLYPNFGPEVRSLLRMETERFLEGVVLEDDGTLRTMLRADYTYLNGPLAEFYGIWGPEGPAFVKTPLDPSKFSGLLTHGSLLALNAKPTRTSPVLRGQFVRERMFCQTPPPPPNDVDTTISNVDPNATTREKFAQHTSDPTCAGCHILMDPIGFGFEHYDAAGLWRDTEHGLAIDDSGEILATEADDGVFHGVAELGDVLAESEQVRSCVVMQWFRFAHGRGETEDDRCSLHLVEEAFAASGGDIRELLVALTQTDAFLYRSNSGQGGTP